MSSSSPNRPIAHVLPLEVLEVRRLLAFLVGFEHLPVGPVGNPATGIYDDPSGIRFTLQSGTGGSPGQPSQIYGGDQGFTASIGPETKVLHPPQWSQQYVITRQDSQSFDLDSFEYGASRHGDAGDFVLTGTFADGSTQQQTVSFTGSKALKLLDVSWTSLSRVRIAFGGGVNNAYGALDSFVFSEEGDDAPPSTAGSLAGADPTAGPVRLRYDGRDFHDVRDLYALRDGRFYSMGQSGIDPYVYPVEVGSGRQSPFIPNEFVTRHNPDGSIDRSYGNEGSVPAEDVPESGFGLVESPAGGFFRERFENGYILRLNDDLSVNTGFADNGKLSFVFGDFTPLWDGGIALLTNLTLRRYDASGSLAGSAVLDSFFDRHSHVEARGLGADALGRIYISYTAFDTGSPSFKFFHGIARFSNELQLDTDFGVAGHVEFEDPVDAGNPDFVTSLQAYVGDDGRAVLRLREEDLDARLVFLAPSGDVLATTPIDFDLGDVAFLDNGGFATAFVELDREGQTLGTPRQTTIGVARFKPDGTFDASYGENGFVTIAVDELTGSLDIIQHPGGLFTFGGFENQVVKDATGLITDVQELGALWRIDGAEGLSEEGKFIDFESASVGQIPSGTFTQDGFVFANLPGFGGTTLEPLVIHGPAQGYATKALSTTNWGRRIAVAREDGSSFDLDSFDYAAGRWGEAGDFILTGLFQDGSTQTQTVPFNSKTFTTLNLGWDDLVGLSINFAGGVNHAYGTVDNFQFGGASEQEVTVDVESAPVGPIPSGVFSEDGFTFTNRPGTGGSATEPLQVLGTPQGFASNVLQTTNWGRRIDIERGGELFSLKRLDYAAGRWGEAGDFVLTGFLAGGGSDTRTVSFSSKIFSTLEIGWEDLTSVSINWAGGANNAYGTIDNLVFSL